LLQLNLKRAAKCENLGLTEHINCCKNFLLRLGEVLGIAEVGRLLVRYHSCWPANSIKALNGEV